MLEAARTRGQRFDDAVALISRGKYREAREAFYKIAMEDPQAKRYRVQLHYAWGLEHLADGKPAEAQRELERALALEPESTDIRSALARVKDAEKAEKDKKPSGILGKLFGR
jgi:predicted Zn-dependent protease